MGNNELSLKDTGKSVSKDRVSHEFRVANIPTILFTEISESLGVSDPREVYTNDRKYTLVELNPIHQNTGFQGAIGLRINEGTLPRAEFVLWEGIPRDRSENVFEAEYVLKIVGCITDGGVWSYGKGNLLSESITAELRFSYGISLKSASTKLISFILYRAHLLTQDPCFQASQFWQSAVWPEKEYTKP